MAKKVFFSFHYDDVADFSRTMLLLDVGLVGLCLGL